MVDSVIELGQDKKDPRIFSFIFKGRVDEESFARQANEHLMVQGKFQDGVFVFEATRYQTAKDILENTAFKSWANTTLNSAGAKITTIESKSPSGDSMISYDVGPYLGLQSEKHTSSGDDLRAMRQEYSADPQFRETEARKIRSQIASLLQIFPNSVHDQNGLNFMFNKAVGALDRAIKASVNDDEVIFVTDADKSAFFDARDKIVRIASQANFLANAFGDSMKLMELSPEDETAESITRGNFKGPQVVQ